MPLVEMKWDPIKPDLKRYTRELQRGMTKLWRGAIGEFVTHIVMNDYVKVDTGMSAASLRDAAIAARIWGATKSTIAFKRKSIQRRGSTDMSGRYNKNSFRDIKAGMAVAEKATQITFDLPIMTFNFDIQVYQWYYWEIMRNEWDALEQGTAAFIKFIDENWEQYVPGLEYLIG